MGESKQPFDKRVCRHTAVIARSSVVTTSYPQRQYSTVCKNGMGAGRRRGCFLGQETFVGNGARRAPIDAWGCIYQLSSTNTHINPLNPY